MMILFHNVNIKQRAIAYCVSHADSVILLNKGRWEISICFFHIIQTQSKILKKANFIFYDFCVSWKQKTFNSVGFAICLGLNGFLVLFFFNTLVSLAARWRGGCGLFLFSFNIMEVRGSTGLMVFSLVFFSLFQGMLSSLMYCKIQKNTTLSDANLTGTQLWKSS